MPWRRKIKPNSEVLRRKLVTDRARPEDAAISPAKAVRQCIARAADQVFGLALRVGGIRQSRLELSDVALQIEDGWGLFPLSHDDGSVGAICVDPSTVTAFVEQQTMGRVSEAVSEPRSLTRTDKALALPLLAHFLRLFDAMMEGAPTAYWTRGYRCDDPVETRHLLTLKLDAEEYRAFDIHLGAIGVNRTGAVRFFLPIKDAGPRAGARGGAGAKSPADQGEAGQNLQSVALDAHVEMEAIMCKVSVVLSSLSEWAPGHLVPLPKDAMRTAHLMDRTRQVSMPVRLGQLHGSRAVRIAPPAAEDAFAARMSLQAPEHRLSLATDADDAPGAEEITPRAPDRSRADPDGPITADDVLDDEELEALLAGSE